MIGEFFQSFNYEFSKPNGRKYYYSEQIKQHIHKIKRSSAEGQLTKFLATSKS